MSKPMTDAVWQGSCLGIGQGGVSRAILSQPESESHAFVHGDAQMHNDESSGV